MKQTQAMTEAADYMDGLILTMEKGIASTSAVITEILHVVPPQEEKETVQCANHTQALLLSAWRSIAEMQDINNRFRDSIPPEPQSEELNSSRFEYGIRSLKNVSLAEFETILASVPPGQTINLEITNKNKPA